MIRDKDFGHCETCHQRFGYYLIHNGFNDSAYAYCDRCGETSILDYYFGNAPIPSGVHLKPHEVIDESIEPFLASCSCGGKFRKTAVPRCPHCSSPLSAIEAAKYIEANAPGAKGGWRWQRTWTDLYCIVIEDKVVHNNWLASK